MALFASVDLSLMSILVQVMPYLEGLLGVLRRAYSIKDDPILLCHVKHRLKEKRKLLEFCVPGL